MKLRKIDGTFKAEASKPDITKIEAALTVLDEAVFTRVADVKPVREALAKFLERMNAGPLETASDTPPAEDEAVHAEAVERHQNQRRHLRNDRGMLAGDLRNPYRALAILESVRNAASQGWAVAKLLQRE